MTTTTLWQNHPPAQTALTLEINTVVARNLDRLAKERGQTRLRFSTDLFLAAYAHRVGKAVGDEEMAAAVNAPEAVPVRDRGRLAGLQSALAALRKSYADLQQELAEAKKVKPVAEQSGEMAELRRKLLDMGRKVAEADEGAKAEADGLRAELDKVRAEAIEAERSLRGKVGGLAREIDRLKALPNSGGDAVESAALKAQAEIVALRAEIAQLKERIAKHQEARADLAKQFEAARRELAAANLKIAELTTGLKKAQDAAKPESSEPVEPPPLPRAGAIAIIEAEIKAIWKAIEELQGPTQIDAQAEADALDKPTVRIIKAYYTTGRAPSDIAKMTGGVSVEAIKIIVGLTPSKTRQALADAKAKAAAR